MWQFTFEQQFPQNCEADVTTLHFLKIRQFWKININNKPKLAMDKLKKSYFILIPLFLNNALTEI